MLLIQTLFLLFELAKTDDRIDVTAMSIPNLHIASCNFYSNPMFGSLSARENRED